MYFWQKNNKLKLKFGQSWAPVSPFSFVGSIATIVCKMTQNYLVIAFVTRKKSQEEKTPEVFTLELKQNIIYVHVHKSSSQMIKVKLMDRIIIIVHLLISDRKLKVNRSDNNKT